jgi:hypothetical protein
MSREELRPPVWVGHVVLYTNKMAESAQFMRTIGMRPIHEGTDVSVFELRGGTHLILLPQGVETSGDATFDLMVDDLRATHERFTSLGLAPSEIEARPAIGHELFQVREPAGQLITFFSSHVGDRTV